MSESIFKQRVRHYLKKTYPNAYVYSPSDKFTSGIPDLLLFNEGCFFFELKIGSNKPTKIQLAVMDKLKRAGCTGGVCYTLDDVKSILTGGDTHGR